MLHIIKKAAYSNKSVLITVRKANGNVVTREIEPYSMAYENGKLYLYCWDRNKEGIRKYRPTSILRAVETPNSFIPKTLIRL